MKRGFLKKTQIKVNPLYLGLFILLVFPMQTFSGELVVTHVGVLEHFQPVAEVWEVSIAGKEEDIHYLEPGDLLNAGESSGGTVTYSQKGLFTLPHDYRFVSRFILKLPDVYRSNVIINGNQLGPFEQNGKKGESRYVIVPGKILDFRGTNEIVVYLTVPRNEAVYVRDFVMARENGLANHISPERINFFNGQLYTFFSIFMTYFTFLYFLVRPKEVFHIYFTAANALFAVYFYRMAFDPLIFSIQLSFTLSKAALLLGVSFFTMAFIHYYNIYNTRKVRSVIFSTGAILALILILTPAESNGVVYSLFSKLLVVMLPVVFFVYWINWKAFRKHNPDARAVFFGISVAVLFAIHDIIFVIFKSFDIFSGFYFAPFMWLQGIGLFIFNISIFSSLALRTMRARADLETHMAKVEELVTERTAELDEATARAEFANSAKTDFLANVSHEMRTPLNAIMGFGEALHDKLQEENSRQYAGLIVDESKRLSEFIDHLLDISKIEAGRLDLVEEPFDLPEMFGSIGEILSPKAFRKGLSLEISLNDDLPGRVVGDSIRLRQVLINLVDNGIKYTPEGSVTLGARLLNEDNGIVLLEFTVTDTGVGIDEKHLARLFDKFYQVEEGRTRASGGFGLGTAISKLIIDKMGGTISVISTPGKGSTFSVRVSLRRVLKGESVEPVVYEDSADMASHLAGCSILAVDDYPTNLKILEYHLESVGCFVTCLESGEEALGLLGKESYDVILMDISMTGIDGLETTRRIRQMGIKTPVVAVTANAYKEEFDSYFKAGMNDVLIKPYKRMQLISAVVRWLYRDTGQTASVQVEGAEMHIHADVLDYDQLLSDFSGNNELVAELLYGFLQDAGARVHRIRAALEEMDIAVLHLESHAIKGGAYTISAGRLAEAAAGLERLARHGGDADYASCFAEVEGEYANLKMRIEETVRKAAGTM